MIFSLKEIHHLIGRTVLGQVACGELNLPAPGPPSGELWPSTGQRLLRSIKYDAQPLAPGVHDASTTQDLHLVRGVREGHPRRIGGRADHLC